jgi:vacuolar-type H+-ATPase subunit H
MLARIEIPTTVGALRADTEKLIEELRADAERFITDVRSDAERFVDTATDTLSQVPARASEVAHDAQEQARTGYHKVLESIK